MYRYKVQVAWRHTPEAVQGGSRWQVLCASIFLHALYLMADQRHVRANVASATAQPSCFPSFPRLALSVPSSGLRPDQFLLETHLEQTRP